VARGSDRYGPGKTCYDRFPGGNRTEPGRRSNGSCRPTLTPPPIWTGTRRSIPASCGCTSTLRAPVKGAHCGRVAGSARDRPFPGRPDHQTASARRGTRPQLGHPDHTGQAADTKELVPLVDAVAVPRPGGHGWHRKRLDHLTADKAYGSKANRRSLRARGITHTIPERDDVLRSPAGAKSATRSTASTDSSSSGPSPPGTTSSKTVTPPR
jgi:hypothetical protein